jgi:predicted esterase
MSTYLTHNLPLSPRLYIYSPTDLLIPSPFVERHAKAAESTGVDVQLEKFEKTGHVAHTRGEGNAARYWGSIGDLWKRSGRDL